MDCARRNYQLSIVNCTLILLCLVWPCWASVSGLYDPVHYDCDGATTAFSFDFPIFTAGDIEVRRVTVSDGAELTLVYPTDFTLAPTGNNYFSTPGGTVTTVATYSSSYRLVISPTFDFEQGTRLRSASASTLRAIETALDKLTLMAQELYAYYFDKTPHFPAGDAPALTTELPPAVLRANKFLSFTSDGSVTASSGPVSGINATAFMDTMITTADNAAEARDQLSALGDAGFLLVTAAGPTDDLDVSHNGQLILIKADTSSNSITLGGTTGADPNDRILLYKSAGANSLIVEHDENGGNQDFLLAGEADLALTGQYQWLQFYFDGTNWLQITDGDGIVVGTNPNLVTPWSLAIDTDGANEPNDVHLVVTNGSTQYLLANSLKLPFVNISDPDNQPNRDNLLVWPNDTGMSFVITEWIGWSDTDNVSLVLKEIPSFTDFSSPTTVDVVEIATDGTGVYYGSDTTISAPVIEAGRIVTMDYDENDDAGYVAILLKGFFISNVD